MAEALREAARTFWAEDRRRSEARISATGPDGSLASAAAVRRPWARFTEHVVEALVERGVDRSWIQVGRDARLPGAYGLSGSAWDLVVRKDGIPLAAATFTQLGGPGSTNNINNRIQDLTSTAFSVRQHDDDDFQPYLGLFFILEESDRVNAPTRRPGESGAARSGPSHKQRLAETFAQFYSDGLYDKIAYASSTTGENPSLYEPRADMSIEGFIEGFAKKILSHSFSPLLKLWGDLTKVPPHLDRYREVIRGGRGIKKDYSLDRVPIEEGGQAAVFRASHKTSGVEVAFKRRLSQRENPSARMRREIDIAELLNDHPNYMPILDFEQDHRWFIMPLAEATAEEKREQLRESDNLRELIGSMGSILDKAHQQGWMHRDIKPSNMLLLDGRWTLADWGVVRRPRGQTTKVGRTGHFIGTEGFAAPELFIKPHEDATAASDIYSLGRVIAWALTGEMPQSNVELLPPPGPWRNIVRAATQQEAERRPQSIDELLDLIDREFSEPHEPAVARAETLLDAANSGESHATDAFLELIASHPDDYGLHLDVLPRLQPELAVPSMSHNSRQAITLLRALAKHVDGNGTNPVKFGEAARAVTWLHGIAISAASSNEWDLLDESIRAMCEWDGNWDQWRPQDAIRSWLCTLRGDVARIVAPAFRDHPDSARHFAELADDRAVDPGIRQAIRAATERHN
ncbi:protein kinase domain-containing protein [Streptomyces akebiae]|uniref:protein kinase domain-containing protein n=1 Tax=Streptomyces akebiae TaxID=2865673 RepID=UPI00294FEF94|nr:PaeR7I family type II restriction endonuclease [Streptomyces akebiae]